RSSTRQKYSIAVVRSQPPLAYESGEHAHQLRLDGDVRVHFLVAHVDDDPPLKVGDPHALGEIVGRRPLAEALHRLRLGRDAGRPVIGDGREWAGPDGGHLERTDRTWKRGHAFLP